MSVIAECVNPLAVTRDAWREAGLGAGARVLETEVVCSDPAEHRRRAETRDVGIPGLVVDTARQPTGEAAAVIEAAARPFRR